MLFCVLLEKLFVCRQLVLHVRNQQISLMLGRINGLQVKECLVNVTAGEARRKHFRMINPLAKIPCLKVLELPRSLT